MKSHFSEENCPNYTKRHNASMWQLHFCKTGAKTGENNSKQWTRYCAIKYQRREFARERQINDHIYHKIFT